MCFPHIVLDDVSPLSFYFSFSIVFAYRCVGKVGEHISSLSWVVILCCESKVRGHPEPNSKRPNTRDEHPLTNVKLFT